MSDPHRPFSANRPDAATGDTSSKPDRAASKQDWSANQQVGALDKQADMLEKEDGTLPNQEWNKDIKAYYDAIASEPIPDEIQQLMASLARAIRD